MTSRFSIPVLTVIKWAVLLAGWRRKRFCARKREGERDRETKTPLMGCLLFGEPSDWGSVGGGFVSQYLPDLDSEESFCLLKHPDAPGSV